MKVRATEQFKKKNVKPKELEYIPETGEEFEVSEERFEILNGKNDYKIIFVERVEEDAKDNEIPKTTKKKARKK